MVISYERIQCYKETKDCSQEGIEKEKQIAMDFIMEGLCDSTKDKVGNFSSAKEIWDKLHNIYSSPIIESKNSKDDANDNYDDEEVYIGEYFFFNCEEHQHIEIEFHYLKIGSDEIENPNEIEDNIEIEKEKNHEADFSQRELEDEIIIMKIHVEEEK